MNKQAQRNMALCLGSMVIGKLTPKVSASVNSSRTIPPHFLVITPTRLFCSPRPAMTTGKSTSPHKQAQVQKGTITLNNGISGNIES